MFSALVFFHLGYEPVYLAEPAYFWLERIYLTYDFGENFFRSRVRLEINQNREPGSFSFKFKVKDAYFSVGKDVFLRAGYQPTFVEVCDSFWGYRLLYKDVLSVFRLSSTRDMGISAGVSRRLFEVSLMLSDAYALGDGIYMASASVKIPVFLGAITGSRAFWLLYGDFKFGRPGVGPDVPSPLLLSMLAVDSPEFRFDLLGFWEDGWIGGSSALILSVADVSSAGASFKEGSVSEERGSKKWVLKLILREDLVAASMFEGLESLSLVGFSFETGSLSVVPNGFLKLRTGYPLEFGVRLSFKWDVKR